jgi:hypothetical protein
MLYYFYSDIKGGKSMTTCKFCNATIPTQETICPECGKEQKILILEDSYSLELEAQRKKIQEEYRRNSILRYFSFFFLVLGLVVIFRLEDKIWIGALGLVVGLVLNRLASQGISIAKEKQKAIERILLTKKD